MCQTGAHTGLPSGAGPRSACVHLTNEMSRREDGATKRSLQTNSPQRWTAQTAPNSVGSLHGVPTDHNRLEVHFEGNVGKQPGLFWLRSFALLRSAAVTDGVIWSTEVADGVIGQRQ